MDENAESMTKEEMQRLLTLTAEEGKSELEAYRALMFVLGIEPPVFKADRSSGEMYDREFTYLLTTQQKFLEKVMELMGLGKTEKAKEAILERLEIIQETLKG